MIRVLGWLAVALFAFAAAWWQRDRDHLRESGEVDMRARKGGL